MALRDVTNDQDNPEIRTRIDELRAEDSAVLTYEQHLAAMSHLQLEPRMIALGMRRVGSGAVVYETLAFVPAHVLDTDKDS